MGRAMCGNCLRPQSVCLCDVLPRRPLSTGRTQLILLQHPHETRHKLATASLVAACLSRCQLLVGRQFRPGLSPLLDTLAGSAPALRPHVLLLFPCAGAVDLSDWCATSLAGKKHDLGAGDASQQGPEQVVLLVVDGTWQHAREMVKASMPFISHFAVPVCFPCDASKEGLGKGEELILRKEPFAGCVSTLEAVARALACLETNGVEIQQKLLSVLRKMVTMQATPRPHKPPADRTHLITNVTAIGDEAGKGNLEMT